MNLLQFITSLTLAVVLAVLSAWNAFAAQENGNLGNEQVKLQTVLSNARAQQNVLEQLLQRTAMLGQKDPEIIELLGKYGVSIKPNGDKPTP